MSITALITMALRALAEYFQLKITSFYYDISERHEQKSQKLRDEITKLRNVGSMQSTLAADKLLLVLENEQRRWDTVSAAYFAVSGRKSDTN